MNPIEAIEKEQLRRDVPAFKAGDTVRVHVRVVEGEKERIQAFQGVVIRCSRGSIRSTFTVRKVSYGVGVERTFPLHSPRIDKIEVLTRGRVRRAKLYYLRNLRGKAARIESERVPVDQRTVPAQAPAVEAAEAAAEETPGATEEAAERQPGTEPASE